MGILCESLRLGVLCVSMVCFEQKNAAETEGVKIALHSTMSLLLCFLGFLLFQLLVVASGRAGFRPC
ncbi:hypothetical protein Pr1d_45300 [Bythopirellula goksoeyrii]|uniref:Uncharacterized protein n=1 Tax=Bythopirellula goksoeyrii TaxID=1400387 RepID=A0A5B9QGY3_9BACT|nr:hypothetical protein Pr1d_45300 [Bythopirellula goksoeyrii]